ncbi:MAG: tetratricopeptide repeat protein [Planctomyces sp.]|nr:tetratricopeptide repeat protein [Planctomyces sp.]
MSTTLLRRAEHASAGRDPVAAIRAWKEYLSFRPRDYRALARLAEVQSQIADTPRAYLDLYQLYERILRSDPENSECRRQLIRLLMRGEYWSDARHHIEILLSREAAAGEIIRDRGWCWLQELQYERAAADFAAAMELSPQDFATPKLLAAVLADRLHRPEEAAGMLDRVVQANPQTARAWLARAEFHDAHGELRRAAPDIAEAWRLAPQDPETLLAAANLLIRLPERPAGLESVDLRTLRDQLQNATARARPGDALAGLTSTIARLNVALNEPGAALLSTTGELSRNPDDVAMRVLAAQLHVIGNNVDAARAELEELREREAPTVLLTFLEARIAMLEGNWWKAIPMLDRLSNTDRAPYFDAHVQRLLGDCHLAAGNFEASHAAYRRAAASDPTSLEAALKLAASYSAQGKPADALTALERFPGLPEVERQRARLLLRLQDYRRPEDRDWTATLDVLNAELQRSPDALETQLFHAELLEQQGQVEAAIAALRQADAAHAENAAATLALAGLWRRQGRSEDAIAALEQARARLGDDPALLAALAAAVRDRPQQVALPQLSKLWGECRSIEGADAVRARQLIAEAILRSGPGAERDEVLNDVRSGNHQDPELWMLAAELGGRTGDRRLIEQAAWGLRALEGDAGGHWRLCEAGLIALDRVQGRPADLRRALALLDESAERMSGSPRLALARAELHALLGDLDAAIRSYRRAIELGERRPEALRRCIGLMLEADQASEARHLLDALPRVAGQLEDLDIQVAVRLNQLDQALEIAARVASGPDAGVEELLLLGQVQAGARRLSESESTFRRATQVAPHHAGGWVGLALVVTAQGRREESERVLQAASVAIAPDRRVEALAVGYEAIGRADLAEELLAGALEQDADNLSLRMRAAELDLRTGARQSGLERLRALVDFAKQQDRTVSIRAKRALAETLLAGSNASEYFEGLEIASEAVHEPGEPDDLRLLARYLARHPSPARRREAADCILEYERRIGGLSAHDIRWLTDLYLSVNDWPKARERLLLALAGESLTADLAEYGAVRFLRNGEPADHWVHMLQIQRPGSPRTVQLTAWNEALQGRLEVAVTMIQERMRGASGLDGGWTPDVASDWASGAFLELTEALAARGHVVAASTFASEAERLLEPMAESDPRMRLRLARLLAHEARIDEALDACERSLDALPVEAATLAVTLLRRDRSSAAEARRLRVQRTLEAASAGRPESADLAFHTATVANSRGDFSSAIAHYRRTIELHPGAIAARNELAILLALSAGDDDEAQSLIEETLTLAGPLPSLLDTRAMVHIAGGRGTEAVADLSRALAEEPDAVKLFHLAQALLQTGDAAGARDAFRRGVAEGLGPDTLHPLEWRAFQELSAKLL